MKLDFGTAGIRGIIGDRPDQLNQAHAARVFDGYAKYLLATIPNAKNRGVVIGRDNRRRGALFTNIAAAILTGYGIKVYWNNDQMLPTPFISFLTISKEAAGAINITASHNPKEYNGIKLYNQHGSQMLPEEITQLKKYFQTYETYHDYFEFDQVVANELVHPITAQDFQNYLGQIQALNFQHLDLSKVQLVYSPLHGSGYDFVKELLTQAKVTAYYPKAETIEDADFSAIDSPNPETASAFDNSIKLANQVGANLILLTDPDADRLGVAVRREADFVLLNGNEMAILICDYLLKYKPRSNTQTNYLVHSVVSTSLPAMMAQKYQIPTHVCETGFKWIGKLIQSLNKQSFFFAFEESYGCLIDERLSRDKDAIQALYLMVILAAQALAEHTSILDQLDAIYQQYGYLKTATLNYNLQSQAQLDQVKHWFQTLNWTRGGDPDHCNWTPQIRTQDETLIWQLQTQTWVALRPSGTEPKYKIYIHVVEATAAAAQTSFDQIVRIINANKV